MSDKPRILIVDDVSSNIHLLMNILKEDYKIIAATNGKKALKLIETTPIPDMILLDILLPDINGYEICKQIKNNPKTSHIPVIFVTSLDGNDELDKGIKVGGVDFITKPFSKDLVLHKVKTYLNISETNDNQEFKQVLALSSENEENSKKSNILVVDDSPENIKVMVEVLKDDYSVSVSTSAKKALAMLESGFTPDLILLDVIMPEMDGYELCEIILSQEKYSHIPIIFVTVLEHEKNILKGFELGAVDYVIKPVEPVVLKARIKTHLKLKEYNDKLLEDLRIKDELIFNQSKLSIIGEMFENITHQWKQPLSVISVITSGVKLDKEYGKYDEEKFFSSLEAIDTSVKYLSDTIDDFKNFLSNDTKQHKFNIKEIIEKTLKLMSSRFKKGDIKIENRVEPIFVTNYQNDLIQVLMNILNNAQDALLEINKDRIIIINSFVEKDRVIISIQDNAGGIKIENIEKIFDKYFTTKSDKDGTGLGLFMSKKIVVERLCGEIDVQNKNGGACFNISFAK